MKKLTNIPKGTFGYIKSRRKRQLVFALLCCVPIVVLLLAGVIIYKTKLNILTVPAMLMVIPMANFLVAFFALLNMDYASPAQHDQLAGWEQEGMLLSDLVFVDEKGRRIPCAFAVVYAGGIVAYTGWQTGHYRKEQVEIPVNDLMKRKGYPARMKAYTSWEEFADRLSTVPAPADDAEIHRVKMIQEAVLSLCL